MSGGHRPVQGRLGRWPQGGQSALPTLWIRFRQSWGRQLRFGVRAFCTALLLPQHLNLNLTSSYRFFCPKASSTRLCGFYPATCSRGADWKYSPHCCARRGRRVVSRFTRVPKRRAAARPSTVSPLAHLLAGLLLCFSQGHEAYRIGRGRRLPWRVAVAVA